MIAGETPDLRAWKLPVIGSLNTFWSELATLIKWSTPGLGNELERKMEEHPFVQGKHQLKVLYAPAARGTRTPVTPPW